jgi:hypothetical protein
MNAVIRKSSNFRPNRKLPDDERRTEIYCEYILELRTENIGFIYIE